MMVLTIRTDKPEAEIGVYMGDTQRAYRTWMAHRELSGTLLNTIDDMLREQQCALKDIEGIVCFAGPGSFTGLRIGLTVANTLAYSLGVPVVATRHDDWVVVGLERLHAGDNDRIALPYYGAAPHITKQRK